MSSASWSQDGTTAAPSDRVAAMTGRERGGDKTASDRMERRAAQLRANLLKRKDLARRRKAGSADAGGDDAREHATVHPTAAAASTADDDA